MTLALGISLIALVSLNLWLAWRVGRNIQNSEDFIVAGRRLAWPLATTTLFATWFGAGTMLTAADEVSQNGLKVVAMEPVGAGLCLVLAGIFFARPLWRMNVLTLGDVYGRRFGPRAELLGSALMIPTYFGWIAVQLIALASILETFFEIPVQLGIIIVAAIGTLLALAGGMWSVAVSDALLFALLLGGLTWLGIGVFELLTQQSSGDVWSHMQSKLPSERFDWMEPGLGGTAKWVGLLAVGALGNLPGQDLLQRIFSARSPNDATRACILAGGLYLIFGAVPVFVGLGAGLLYTEGGATGILPALAHQVLSPGLALVLIVTLSAAVLSTIDSALLSPATVIAHNLLPPLRAAFNRPSQGEDRNNNDQLTLRSLRASVVFVAVISVLVAYVGESAYSLLEAAYELGLTSLMIPLAMAIWGRSRHERSALAAMVVGAASWAIHLIAGWDTFLAPLFPNIPIPTSLAGAVLSAIAYLGWRRRR